MKRRVKWMTRWSDEPTGIIRLSLRRAITVAVGMDDRFVKGKRLPDGSYIDVRTGITIEKIVTLEVIE